MPRPLPYDLINTRFGRLVVLRVFSDMSRGYQRTLAEVQCDCGVNKIVHVASLKAGTTTSCGCYCAEYASARMTRHGHSTTKYHSPTHRSWMAMRERCMNPNANAYERYGGRGITICERWDSYETFLEDMGARPDKTSLDRIDNSKGYYPENCKWATSLEQGRNRSNNKLYEYQGEMLPISVIAERTGVERHLLGARLRTGWEMSRAITTPKLHIRRH